MKKKKLFVFCSWDGSFFREQAKLVEDIYDVEILTFASKSIRDILKFNKIIKFGHYTSSEKMSVNTVEYIDFWFLPEFLHKMVENYRIKKLVNHLKIDANSAIHVNTIYPAGFWAYLVNKKHKTPYLLDEHQKFILFNKPKRTIRMIQDVISNAKKILVVSHDEARQMLTKGFHFDFEVIGNYVNEKLFFPVEKPKSNVFKLVSIGAFSYFKDPQTIFKTLKVLDEFNLNKSIEFHYLGYKGWGVDKTEEIKKIITDNNYKNINVILHPETYSRAKTASLLQQSDLFILSSIMEGMCVSLMEALATGLPVCTTQCGGVDELIDETNGKILQIRDHKGMALYIKDVIEEKITFNKQHIANKLISEYGNKAFKNKLIKYYQEAFFN